MFYTRNEERKVYMKTKKTTNFICPILSVQQRKFKCYNLSLNFSILSEYCVVKYRLIMAGADMVNVSLSKDLRHNFFWVPWFWELFLISKNNFQTAGYNTANILPFTANHIEDNLLCN